MQVDQIDAGIIAALQKNARLSNKALAAEVHISESSCLVRVRRLVEQGTITAFRANVDLKALGRPLEAMIAIRYRHTQRMNVEDFVESIRELPETLELYHLTGAQDYLLHVAVPDTESLRRFVLESLLRRPEIERLQTSLIYEHYEKRVVEVLPGSNQHAGTPRGQR
jgi:DNA-binding Lrp family transcriptional regulator